jgi:hypothetical protein
MQTQIENLVQQLTGNATMFTAFDITMMLRRANPTTNIKHPEVRDTVHQLYSDNQMSGYVRDLVPMSNGQEAFVYHSYGTDAEDYDPNFFVNTTPQFLSVPNALTTSTQAVVNPLTPMPQTLTTSRLGRAKRARYDQGNVPQDKFGRIRVPASVLIVVTSVNDNYGAGKNYVVDQYNNIRVHLRGKFGGNHFAMQPSASNRRIYITPV